MSTRLVVPPNITIIALPPRCPELNPVENVWQFMRDNWLSNRVFKSYDDLVDHYCEASSSADRGRSLRRDDSAVPTSLVKMLKPAGRKPVPAQRRSPTAP
jgi:hypothetical protein